MEENKFYKNAELSKESEEDFKKNVKNSFSTEDFSRQLDLAMYLSKSKFKQVFFNQPLIAPDTKHSQVEERFFALGRTDMDRYLFLVFTMRGRKIRIISARDMNKKERKIYGS